MLNFHCCSCNEVDEQPGSVQLLDRIMIMIMIITIMIII